MTTSGQAPVPAGNQDTEPAAASEPGIVPLTDPYLRKLGKVVATAFALAIVAGLGLLVVWAYGAAGVSLLP